MASDSEAVKKSQIFIWGQIGEMLKGLDPERVLTCLQKNPNASLYNIFRERLMPLLAKIREANGDPYKTSLIRDELQSEADAANSFREIASFMSGGLDELSMGSALLGEIKNPEAEQDDIFIDADEDD